MMLILVKGSDIIVCLINEGLSVVQKKKCVWFELPQIMQWSTPPQDKSHHWYHIRVLKGDFVSANDIISHIKIRLFQYC